MEHAASSVPALIFSEMPGCGSVDRKSSRRSPRLHSASWSAA